MRAAPIRELGAQIGVGGGGMGLGGSERINCSVWGGRWPCLFPQIHGSFHLPGLGLVDCISFCCFDCDISVIARFSCDLRLYCVTKYRFGGAAHF